MLSEKVASPTPTGNSLCNSKVNQLELDSAELKKALLTGRLEDISQVVVAGQKAEIALQLTLQLRNRAVSAYQEMIRMQV